MPVIGLLSTFRKGLDSDPGDHQKLQLSKLRTKLQGLHLGNVSSSRTSRPRSRISLASGCHARR